MHPGGPGRTPIRQLIDALTGPLANSGDSDIVMSKASDDIASAAYGITRQRLVLDTVRARLAKAHSVVKSVLGENDGSYRAGQALRLSELASDLSLATEFVGSCSESMSAGKPQTPKSTKQS